MANHYTTFAYQTKPDPSEIGRLVVPDQNWLVSSPTTRSGIKALSSGNDGSKTIPNDCHLEINWTE
jgi:hypothetical protein